MSDTAIEFMKAAENKAFNLDHRRKIKFNISRYDDAVAKGKRQYQNLELAKETLSSHQIQSIKRY